MFYLKAAFKEQVLVIVFYFYFLTYTPQNGIYIYFQSRLRSKLYTKPIAGLAPFGRTCLLAGKFPFKHDENSSLALVNDIHRTINICNFFRITRDISSWSAQCSVYWPTPKSPKNLLFEWLGKSRNGILQAYVYTQKKNHKFATVL